MPYGKTYLQAHCRISLYTSILNGHKKDINSSLYIFDCLASYLAYLWNAMRLKQRVGHIEYINEGDLNNKATFRK